MEHHVHVAECKCSSTVLVLARRHAAVCGLHDTLRCVTGGRVTGRQRHLSHGLHMRRLARCPGQERWAHVLHLGRPQLTPRLCGPSVLPVLYICLFLTVINALL